jgi:hypothetical protein
MLKKFMVGSLLLLGSFSAKSQESDSAKFADQLLVKKSYFDNVKNLSDLKIANEKLRLANTTDISGRVAGYRVTLLSKGMFTSEYSYGDVFVDSVVGLINSSKNGDSILIDNIIYNTVQGAAKLAKPLTFKIVE